MYLSRPEGVGSIARSDLVHHAISLERARLKRHSGAFLPSRLNVVHGSQDQILSPYGVKNAAVYDLLREDRVGTVSEGEGAER